MTDLLVNLGCGDRYASGWVNVDHAACPHRKDLTLDLINDELPWRQGELLHVYMGHVLEHLPRYVCLRLLTRLRPLVQPEGQVLVVGPDVDAAERMIEEGTFDFSYGHTLESLRFGADRWGGDRHEWECTARRVIELLEDSGWSDVQDVGIENVAPFWPVADRRPLWQCAVTARS